MSDIIAADQLRLFIERVERLEEEKKGMADDIREVYSEAKGQGYDLRSPWVAGSMTRAPLLVPAACSCPTCQRLDRAFPYDGSQLALVPSSGGAPECVAPLPEPDLPASLNAGGSTPSHPGRPVGKRARGRKAPEHAHV